MTAHYEATLGQAGARGLPLRPAAASHVRAHARRPARDLGRPAGDHLRRAGPAYSGAEAVAELLGDRPDTAMVPAAASLPQRPPRHAGAAAAAASGSTTSSPRSAPANSPSERGRKRLDGATRHASAPRTTTTRSSPAARSSGRCSRRPLKASHGRTLVDASPGNLMEAQTLVRLFPEARFVHVVRDGRDVAPRRPRPKLPHAASPRRSNGGPTSCARSSGESGGRRTAPVTRSRMRGRHGRPRRAGVRRRRGGVRGSARRSPPGRRARATGRVARRRSTRETIGRGRWRRYARGPAVLAVRPAVRAEP